MNHGDSAFPSLLSACHPATIGVGEHAAQGARVASALACRPLPESVVPSLGVRGGPPEPAWVVVVKSVLRPTPALEFAGAESLRSKGHDYRVDWVSVIGLDCIAHFHDKTAPRVLIVDLELVARAGIDAMHRHRRGMPGTDLLLAADAASHVDPSLVSRCRARGSVEWSMGRERLAQALDAVLAGELWFSRRMLQAMYLAFLEGGLEWPAQAHASALPSALTSRESEVLDYMRDGLTNKQIAERLGISINTVKKHLAHVYEKRGLHNGRQMLV